MDQGVSAMRPPQPLLTQYHPPFTLPSLPYRSSPLAPPPAPTTSSDPPSSPTATSFYPSLPPPSRPPRAHKSQSSSRHSSSPNTLRAQTLEKARLARKPLRVVEEVENPFVVGMYGSGGMRNGVWEEYTEEEMEVLGRTGGVAARRERALVMERGEDEAWGLERLAEEEEEEQEPPAELLLDEDENDYLASALSLPRLPSLASDPFYDAEMDLDEPISSPNQPAAEEGAMAFELALLGSACPACQVEGSMKGDSTGARCAGCGWGIEMGILDPLAAAFVQHGDPRTHRPLFAWTEYTGTLVLCDGCDEEYGA